jgi:hypothetical protein
MDCVRKLWLRTQSSIFSGSETRWAEIRAYGKQLLVLACFAHEFEDQEFMKSQVAKALEVAGELAQN